MNPYFVAKITAAKGLASVSRQIAADPEALRAALLGPSGAKLCEELCFNIRGIADQIDALANDAMQDKETIDWLITKLNGGAQ